MMGGCYSSNNMDQMMCSPILLELVAFVLVVGIIGLIFLRLLGYFSSSEE